MQLPLCKKPPGVLRIENARGWVCGGRLLLGLGSAVPGVLGVGGGVRGVAGVGLVYVGAVGLGVGIGVRVGVGIGAVPGSVCVAVGGVFGFNFSYRS